MPRPKTLPDGDVVRATARVLLRLGPARFTLADVAAESGLSPATLLQRFGSKRGLLVAFARSAADQAAEPFTRARAEISSPLRALRAALVRAADDLGSRQEVANSLAVLLDDLTDEAMGAAAARHAKATERAIRELLDEAIARGELADTDTARLALVIQCAWNGAVIQWALRGKGRFESLLGPVLGALLPDAPPARRRRTPPPRRTERRTR